MTDKPTLAAVTACSRCHGMMLPGETVYYNGDNPVCMECRNKWTESKHLKLMRETLAQLERALPDISYDANHAELKERIQILKEDIHTAANWERLQDARKEPDAPTFQSGPCGGI